MTSSLKTQLTESPFKMDNTASNRCGFTLMNNQVGAVVAQVMSTKPNVTVMPLPSMIRVDAVGRMDVVYDEISDALGEEPGYLDAAEYLGFDLVAE
jgi:propane monooxygenase coupling protein